MQLEINQSKPQASFDAIQSLYQKNVVDKDENIKS